jgi:hypothetical protein
MIAPIPVFGPTWSQPSFFPQLRDAFIAWTGEQFETIAERYDDLATIGPGLDLEGGS